MRWKQISKFSYVAGLYSTVKIVRLKSLMRGIGLHEEKERNSKPMSLVRYLMS
jgi:hypothetical protein